MSEIKSIKGFMIADSNNKIVFELHSNKSFKFHNLTLAQELTQGILIPPFSRDTFAGRKIVKSPGIDPSVTFELFEQAIRFHYESTLSGDGFKLIENASEYLGL